METHSLSKYLDAQQKTQVTLHRKWMCVCVCQGAIQGPEEFVEGMALGVKALVGGAVGTYSLFVSDLWSCEFRDLNRNKSGHMRFKSSINTNVLPLKFGPVHFFCLPFSSQAVWRERRLGSRERWLKEWPPWRWMRSTSRRDARPWTSSPAAWERDWREEGKDWCLWVKVKLCFCSKMMWIVCDVCL